MRCFLAIELPPAARAELEKLQRSLRVLDRQIRWTRPGQIHLTLSFLGEVPDAEVPAICRAVADAAGGLPAFDLRLEGTGCFPPRGPVRVIWAGVRGDLPALHHCQRTCLAVLESCGYPPEDRPYHPHLTIGRVRPGHGGPDVRAALEPVAGFTGRSFPVGELVLFQSLLNPQGPHYLPLVRARLGPRASQEAL